ncbi:MAG: alpha/beta fold hydrolase, partial [Pseudomonadota bacterium]
LNPDWSDVVRANNGATRLTRELRRELGREIGRDLDGAGAAPLLPFPFRETAREEQGARDLRFLRADLALKARLAAAWIAAAEALIQHAPAEPAVALPLWADALDHALHLAAGRPGYAAAQAEWLRAALEAGIPLTPPEIALPADLPSIARTPKEEVWRDGPASLSRYRAGVGAPLGPLIIVHGLINRQTVTDLLPGCSLVECLIARGMDLWVMDWGAPEGRDLAFSDYVGTWLGRAIATVTAETERRPALFGICQGGVFALCRAALHPDDLSGLALTGTPVDFHADRDCKQESGRCDAGEGALNRLARDLPRDVIEDLLSAHDGFPGALTGALFQGMTPGRTFVKYTLGLARQAGDPEAFERFLAMEAWLADRPDHPAPAAREWLYHLYQDNALIAGQFRLAGHAVTLDAIRCPVLNLTGRRDHIVPPACSRALEAHLAPGLYEAVETDTGHIGVMVSQHGKDRAAAALTEWLERRPQHSA